MRAGARAPREPGTQGAGATPGCAGFPPFPARALREGEANRRREGREDKGGDPSSKAGFSPPWNTSPYSLGTTTMSLSVLAKPQPGREAKAADTEGGDAGAPACPCPTAAPSAFRPRWDSCL